MKKKLLTSLGCLALAVAGAFGLVGCGGPVEHTVSFGNVTANFGVGGEQTYTIKGVDWEEITEANGDVNFDNYKGAWQVKADQGEKQVSYVEQKLNGTDNHYVCITFAGKGADITKVFAKATTNYQDLAQIDWAQNQNEDADPDEQEKDAFHFLIGVSGTETSTAKTVYLFLDWDGKEETKGDQEIYKFVIPAGLALEAAPEA